MRAAVGLIAKAPAAGAVKTRLCPPLSSREAAELAAAMLADTASSALAAGPDVWCVHDGPAPAVRRCLPAGVRLLAQRGDGLAERLAAAQADLHGRGYGRVVLLGGDCPTVDAAYLATTIAALDEAAVVLGPAADGGYTLIGSRAPDAGLFTVEMSTPRVLADTLARARSLALPVRCLEPRYDLDTIDDVAAALAAGQLAHARRTRALLNGMRVPATVPGARHGPPR